jgi:ATP-dependent helicase/nuclease subunit A
MLFDSSLGAGAHINTEAPDNQGIYTHRTLPYAALSRNAVQRTLSEEMRILYVALTRARQKVIVTAALMNPIRTVDEWKKNAQMEDVSYLASSARKWIDWIGLSLLVSYTSLSNASPGLPAKEGPVTLIVQPQTDETDLREEEQSDVADPAQIASINRRMEFVYERAALAELPGKLSVSSLVSASHTFSLYRPVFSRDKLTPAERGTAIHTFMQCADLLSASNNVEAEIDRLVASQYIDRAAAESINRDDLGKFFASALCQSMLSFPVLREYAFIDTLDAGQFMPDLPEHLRSEKILIQGKADCIILKEDAAILVDYKSDKVQSAAQLATLYREQLALYRRFITPRLDVPIRSCMLYSFVLGQAIEVWNDVENDLYGYTELEKV